MKIISELLGKEFKTTEECLAAEKEYTDKVAAANAEKEKLAKEKRQRAKEIEDAYTNVLNAQKEYNKLKNDFIKDYGSFHMTYRDNNKNLSTFDDLINTIFNIW